MLKYLSLCSLLIICHLQSMQVALRVGEDFVDHTALGQSLYTFVKGQAETEAELVVLEAVQHKVESMLAAPTAQDQLKAVRAVHAKETIGEEVKAKLLKLVEEAGDEALTLKINQLKASQREQLRIAMHFRWSMATNMAQAFVWAAGVIAAYYSSRAT